MVFTEIDATEYLDDLWGKDGPHMHLHITKFEEVCIYYYRMYVWICLRCVHTVQEEILARLFTIKVFWRIKY